ncbi:MAG: hypothetical protein JO115_10480 [Pseudonocardiales bacterium]|nr:hypothetical protein [Pseudonocardiales bacterium]
MADAEKKPPTAALCPSCLGTGEVITPKAAVMGGVPTTLAVSAPCLPCRRTGWVPFQAPA